MLTTMQEVFDVVVAHLLTQNRQSLNYEGSCAYRGENGLKCAVGVLIADECYSPTLENRLVSSPLVVEALACSGVEAEGELMNLLTALQWIHDDRQPGNWDYELSRVAETFKLELNPPRNSQQP